MMIFDSINQLSQWLGFGVILLAMIATSITWFVFCSFCGRGVKSQSAIQISQSTRQQDLVIHQERGTNWNSMIHGDDERDINSQRPRDHEIRLPNRPISTVKPKSRFSENINRTYPKLHDGFPKKEVIVNKVQIVRPQGSANSSPKLNQKSFNNETSPLNTSKIPFYGLQESPKFKESRSSGFDDPCLHGEVNLAFENSTPEKHKTPCFKPVYAHTDEERSAMLERNKKLTVNENTQPVNLNTFETNHRYRTDSQKYFWNSSMRTGGENEGHSLSSLSPFPTLSSRGTSVRSVCKNGEFKSIRVNQNSEHKRPHGNQSKIVPGNYFHPRSYFNSPNLVTRRLSDASDYSNASHYAQGPQNHSSIFDFDKTRTRSIKNTDNRNTRFSRRRQQSLINRDRDILDTTAEILTREKEFSSRLPYPLPETPLTPSPPNILSNFEFNANQYEDQSRIYSPSNSQWNSIYHWGSRISRPQTKNYTKHRNSPETQISGSNTAHGKPTYQNTHISSRDYDQITQDSSRTMLDDGNSPTLNRPLEIKSHIYDCAQDIQSQSKTGKGFKTGQAYSNDKTSQSTKSQFGSELPVKIIHESPHSLNKSKINVQINNNDDDYTDPIDCIRAPNRPKPSPNFRGCKSPDVLLEDVVPGVQSNYMYILPVDSPATNASKNYS